MSYIWICNGSLLSAVSQEGRKLTGTRRFHYFQIALDDPWRVTDDTLGHRAGKNRKSYRDPLSGTEPVPETILLPNPVP